MDYAQHQQSTKPQSRQALGLGAVVLLHLLVIYAVASGLAGRFVKTFAPTVEAQLIEEYKPETALPLPLTRPPKSEPPQKTAAPDVVPPVELTQATASAPNAISPVTSAPKSAPAQDLPLSAQAPTPSVRTAAVINASMNCETPVYPSVSRRMQESGTVQLRFHIGVDGKVMESEVEKSSGFKRLDEAARVALSKCQFKPATVDGKPEASWSSLRYIWKIDE